MSPDKPQHAAARKLPRWPLIPVAMSAMVSVWGGWVSLGALTGFGDVTPLPGVAPGFHVDLALTLPVSVEAYAAYAIAAWLGPWAVRAAARRFAMSSSVAALVLGASGQVSYHLLAAAHASRAPWPVTVAVSCVPVVVIGCAAALTHLLRGEPNSDVARQPSPVSPLIGALAARIAPRPAAPSLADVLATPPEATGAAPPERQVPRQPARQRGDRRPPAWHAIARRAVARDSAISAEDLARKCRVSVRSAQRYLADAPEVPLHAVRDAERAVAE